MILEEKVIVEEVEKLEQQREQVIAQINQVLGEIKGKIDLYNNLLAQAKEEKGKETAEEKEEKEEDGKK